MGLQILENGVGERIAAIRLARSSMSQEDLARAIGVHRMTVSRWESGAQIVDKVLKEIAEALRVTESTLRGEGPGPGRVLELLIGAGATIEPLPPSQVESAWGCACTMACFEILAGACSRVLVVCAPVIGGHQVQKAIAMLRHVPQVHHVFFVSEEAPDRSAKWALRKAASFPELHLLRSEELEGHMFSLAELAHGVQTLAHGLPLPAFEPRLAFSDGDTEPQPSQNALWCWISDEGQSTHLAIVGAPGSGKTTAVRRFAAALATAHLAAPDQRPCPVYVPLWSMLDATDLRARLAQEIQSQLGLASRVPVERALNCGRLLVILDGVDELVGRNPARLYAVERAIALLFRLPGRVLMTARTPMFFTGLEQAAISGPGQAPRSVRVATLLPLERPQVQGHLARIAEGGVAMLDLVRRHELMDLACSPYVLDILVEGAPLYLKPFSGGRPVLSNLLNRRYQAWLYDDAPHFQRGLEDLRGVLGGLAETLRRVGRVRGFRDDLGGELQQALFPAPGSACPPPPARSRFLVIESDSFQFIHRLMEEYFFSSWVAEQIREHRSEALRAHWIDRHDLTLLSGLLREKAQVESLSAWAADPCSDEDLRELALYLLAFTGDKGLPVETLQAIRASQPEERRSRTLDFSLVALGDLELLQQTVHTSVELGRSHERSVARLTLLSLGLHEALLPPPVQERVRQALAMLQPYDLHDELVVLVRSPELATTERAAAVTALGYLGDPRAPDIIKSLLGTLALHGLTGAPSALRLTNAARLALELVGARRFPGRAAHQGPSKLAEHRSM